MSYEEFWRMDYRLVESYVKKHELDIERETMFNWEQAQNIRMVLLESLSILYPPKGGKKFEFPKRPSSRTDRGQKEDKRNKMIDFEIKRHFEDVMQRVKDRRNEDKQ